MEWGLFSPSLFELVGQPPFVIADLGDIKRHCGGKGEIEKGLQLIASDMCRNRAFLMVSTAKGPSALDSWKDAISASTYIEEPSITPQNFDLALSFLTKSTDLAISLSLQGAGGGSSIGNSKIL